MAIKWSGCTYNVRSLGAFDGTFFVCFCCRYFESQWKYGFVVSIHAPSIPLSISLHALVVEFSGAFSMLADTNLCNGRSKLLHTQKRNYWLNSISPCSVRLHCELFGAARKCIDMPLKIRNAFHQKMRKSQAYTEKALVSPRLVRHLTA